MADSLGGGQSEGLGCSQVAGRHVDELCLDEQVVLVEPPGEPEDAEKGQMQRLLYCGKDFDRVVTDVTAICTGTGHQVRILA